VAMRQLAKINYEIPAALPEFAELAAEITRDEAKRRAPVQSGRLRDSIRVNLGERAGGKAESIVVVGAFYGYFVEHGTRKMSARPYLRPAIDATRSQIRQAVGDAFRIRTRKITR